MLERAIRWKRLESRWRMIAACTATADATAHLLADGFAESRTTRDAPGAIEVAARDGISYLAEVDLVKMDIDAIR